MKSKQVLVLALLGSLKLVSGSAWAQTETEVSVGQQLVQQFGPAALPGASLLTTQSTLIQNGNRNLAQIEQVGTGLSTTVVQTGNSNVARSKINGTDVASDIVQRGSLNVVEQQLTVDQRRYAVSQLGNNNQLTQVETGGAAAAPGYSVEMVGNGIKLNIQQGNIVSGAR